MTHRSLTATRAALLLGTCLLGCPASPDAVDLGEASAGHLELEGASATAFNSAGAALRFRAVGASLDPAAAPPIVLLNGVMLASTSVVVTPEAIALPAITLTERNDLEVLAWDDTGGELALATTLWTGSHTLDVTVTDENGAPLSGATVRASLGADRGVFAETTSVDGKATFPNLPERTIALDGKASGNRFAALPITGAAGKANLRFVGWSAASTVDNNDFHDGSAGWTASNPSAVKLVPHTESVSSMSLRSDTAATDMDLVLQTAGIGAQTISRAFTIKEGTRVATLRYRFLTSEIPGGYYGTRYDDYFTVTLRSKASGHMIQEENSMNAMGLSAFSASGATAWREIPLLVDPGDTIQVDVSVANVADGLYDSSVVVDMIQERTLAVTESALQDIDGAELEYLSTGAHPYFGGVTRVNGKLRLEGKKGDIVDYVHLDVLQAGQVVAIGDLGAAARNALLRAFGEDEKLEVTGGPLFEITSAQLEGVDPAADSVSLRITAATTKGERAVVDKKPVPLLVRYTGTNRYGPEGRDGERGGDDWMRPSTKAYLEYFSTLGLPGFVLGDASNMNGGSFKPPHETHRNGRDADLWFEGYNERDAATAAMLLELLDAPTYGPKIDWVIVTFEAKAGEPFFDAIADRKLADGRMAKEVFRPETKKGSHKSHFHVRFR